MFSGEFSAPERIPCDATLGNDGTELAKESDGDSQARLEIPWLHRRCEESRALSGAPRRIADVMGRIAVRMVSQAKGLVAEQNTPWVDKLKNG